MAEKPNEEENSQSSQLARGEDLQKLVGDGGNNACSKLHGRQRGEGKQFVFFEQNPLSLALAQLILTLVSDHVFAVYKILLFSL